MTRWLVLLVLLVAPALGIVLSDAEPARAAAPTSSSASSSAPPPSASPPASSGATFTHPPGGFADAIPCNACHSTTSWKQRGSTSESGGFDHSTTGFPLTGEHLHAPCVGCHNTRSTLKRDCASCHEDAHRGRLLQTCDACHTPAGWRITRPLELHRMTRFPLTGMHVLADCTECHLRTAENRWTDAPVECFACHEKDYRMPTNFPVHVGTPTSPALPRDCSLCHRATAWVPASVPASLPGSIGSVAMKLQRASLAHEVRFPISFGSHRLASCDDCHSSASVPRATRCTGCHAHDPVVVMRQHRQPVAMDGPACLTCHPGGARR